MKPFRSRIYLDLSYIEKTCLRCGAYGCEPCHFSGQFSDRVGKGAAQKASDLVAADLCRKCHVYFDTYQAGNGDARAAEFLTLCWQTFLRNVALGHVEVIMHTELRPGIEERQKARKRGSQCVASAKTLPRRH